MKSIASVLIVVILGAVIATVGAAQTPSARAQLFHPIHQQQQQQYPQLRSVYDNLPDVGDSTESFLQYCEAVIHALESELPRKSVFRSLFIDKARLSSGYDKHIKFTYYDVLKNQINN